MAASLSGAGPARLDTTLSSHPPFGSLLLGLGLLGPSIFPAPIALDSSSAEAMCVISAGNSGSAAIVQRVRQTEGWGLRVDLGSSAAAAGKAAATSIAAEPMSCIDLVDRAAVLLDDGSIVIAMAPLNSGAQPRLSAPLAGPWSSIAPLGEGGGGGLLARAADGVWWRIDDPISGGGKISTGFAGEQLLGIGSVAALDGSGASLDAAKANKIGALLNVCGSANCGAFAERLIDGRAYLNGDVEDDARPGFRENLAAIAPVAYGHARAAIGLTGDQIVLVDLDHPDVVLASVPFTATKLRMALSRASADGFRVVLSTKGRMYSVVASLFPSPTISLTATARFSQIDGVYPAGGDGLLAVAIRDAAGDPHLKLMESLRLKEIEGRALDAPLTEVGPYAVSLRGTGHSILLAHAARTMVTIDTAAASARLRLPLFVAVGLLVGAVVLLASVAGAAGAVAAGIALLLAPPLWDLGTVGMLDGLLAALLAVALAAAAASIDATRAGPRRLLLFGAGALTGLAAGVKLSALIAGAPLLAVVAIARSWREVATVARRAMALIAALGAGVAAAALITGAGFGAALNLLACGAIVGLALRDRGRIDDAPLRSRIDGVVLVSTGVIAGVLAAFVVPVLIGINIGGPALAVGDALRLWFAEGAKIAEGFLIDHPLGLPFWGLALGLGVGFAGSVAPGAFAALWAAIGTRFAPGHRAGPATQMRTSAEQETGARIIGLLLFSALTLVVWAPLSRILFPWYGATMLVPLAAAFGVAFASRDRRLIPMLVGAACGPAIAWLSGPTLCLAAVTRLDRGCQAIGSTDVAGTAVLVIVGVTSSLTFAVLLRRASRSPSNLPRFLRSPGMLLIAALAGTVAVEFAALSAAAHLQIAPLSAFPVVVAMEIVWGGAIAAVLVLWRRVSIAVPLLFGGSALVLEAARAIDLGTSLRPWYLAATQVDRVIPQPQLHPVPLVVVVIAGLIIGFIGAVARSVADFGLPTPLMRYYALARGSWKRLTSGRGERWKTR
ncbi:MAG: hypothetical protein ACR2JL_04265 [Candidatus Limnocylindrus sp.]